MKLSLVAIFMSLWCSTGTTNARGVDTGPTRKVKRDTDSNLCKDSQASFKIMIDGTEQRKNCSWLEIKDAATIRETCQVADIETHCKKTCEIKNCCVDSTVSFKSESRFVTCNWVGRKDGCLREGVTETCMRTCTTCTPPLSLEERMEAIMKQADQQKTKMNEFETHADRMDVELDTLGSVVESFRKTVEELENANKALVSRLDSIESSFTHCCPTHEPSSASSAFPSVSSNVPSHGPSSNPSSSLTSDEPSHTPDVYSYYLKGPKQITKSVEGNPAAVITGLTNYILKFTINPTGTQSGWSSIIHFGNSNADQVPAIWFHSDSTMLFVGIGNTADGYTHHHIPDFLELNKESMIEVRVIDRSATVLVNRIVKKTFEIGDQSPLGEINVYIGDPWHNAANAIISDVSFR